MGKIISYILSWLAKKGLWSFVYYGLATTYFFSMVAMITAFFVALDFFISKIKVFLATLSTYSGGGEIVSKFFGLLNCIGFTSALSDTSPVIVSGIVFLLARILIIEINSFYKEVFGIVSSIMKTGV